MIKFFTSESVTEGHPDKLCYLISDSILDAYLAKDAHSRVACETLAGKDMIVITGEITSNAKVDIEHIVRDTIKSIGYSGINDIDYNTCKVLINISSQSPDIALGTNDVVGGAGDQGMMFGYACKDTKEYMPIAITLAHALTKRLTEVRKEGIVSGIGADGKAQVTIRYNDDKIDKVDTILISCQHHQDKDLEELYKDIKKEVIDKVIPKKLLDKNTKILINPTGRFVIGGPLGDSGLTGRKIIVDTYGGYAHHGGGAFSGKDATKVDRSAAYMARYIAKNIVANKYADKCEIQIAYAIGKEEPVSIYVDTFGTGTVSDDEIISIINRNFDLRPRSIIKILGLTKPIYTKTTNYGHFGKKELPWEKVIKIK
jgi:S-adenosylmethionine synthetase